MKKSLLFVVIGLVLPMSSQASGCFPWDVYLQDETALADAGTFKVEQICNDKGCTLSASSTNSFEHQTLIPQNPSQKLSPKDLGTMALKVYRQYFVSSCYEETRYILGVDIDGIRYRQLNDLTEL